MSRIAPCSLLDAYRWSQRHGWVRVHGLPEEAPTELPKATEARVSNAPSELAKRGSKRMSWNKDTVVKLASPPKEEPKPYTQAMFRTFDRLSTMVCSTVISDRARGRVWLDRFIQKNGPEICEAILDDIRKRDAEAWFKDKSKRRGA